MKKLISFFLVFLTLIVFTLPCASALLDSGAVTSKLGSEVYYMENLDQSTVIFDKDSTKRVPLAGYAKVLAACVALEKWGNLDGKITITENHLNVFESIFGMMIALYEEGETVTKKELFDCLIVSSANDALSIIAYDVAGTEAKLVSEMQKLAERIGCEDTSVKNIHGFDQEGQYTTARDVAKIIKHAVTFPVFTEAFAKDEITLKATDKNDERTYYSSNQMLNASVYDYYHSSVKGGKHTSTELAGECMAAVSSADGYSYLTVVMGGKYEDIDGDGYDENTSMTDIQRMLDWVYENIRFKVIANHDQVLANVKVVAGKGVDRIELIPEKEISALVPAAATPASVMFDFGEDGAPEKIVAPVKEGDVITQADIYYAGQKITTIDVVAKQTVSLSLGGLIVTGLKKVIGSVIFMVISLVAAVIGVLRFVLDLKDFLDKDRKKSFDPLPSSFEVLTEKFKTAVTFGGKKNKKKNTVVKGKKAPVRKGSASSTQKGKPVKKTRKAPQKKTAEAPSSKTATKKKAVPQKKKTPVAAQSGKKQK